MATAGISGDGCGSGKVCANEPQTTMDLIHDCNGAACVRGERGAGAWCALRGKDLSRTIRKMCQLRQARRRSPRVSPAARADSAEHMRGGDDD